MIAKQHQQPRKPRRPIMTLDEMRQVGQLPNQLRDAQKAQDGTQTHKKAPKCAFLRECDTAWIERVYKPLLEKTGDAERHLPAVEAELARRARADYKPLEERHQAPRCQPKPVSFVCSCCQLQVTEMRVQVRPGVSICSACANLSSYTRRMLKANPDFKGKPRVAVSFVCKVCGTSVTELRYQRRTEGVICAECRRAEAKI
jgi:hypothetical protein